jgi:hypothetical protein
MKVIFICDHDNGHQEEFKTVFALEAGINSLPDIGSSGGLYDYSVGGLGSQPIRTSFVAG